MVNRKVCINIVAAFLVAATILPVSIAQADFCGLTNAALCETFDAPAGIGNRSGQLNGTLWGVSHFTGNQNFPDPTTGWGIANLSLCGNPGPVIPDHDIFICNGQLVEGQYDNGGVTSIAMYPKQPFDFAGRTGKIAFDVSDDSQGSHTAWPELWVTDRPGPAPFTHETGGSVPRNGFGIRFAGASNGCVGVDSADVVTNFVENDSFMGQGLVVTSPDCVLQPKAPGQLNHFEVDVTQSQIDIYGTDAGTTTPLKHVGIISNPNLQFTRGLVWIEDVHYNGNKFGTQGTHSFTWDNVGFDGPVLPRDLTYDILDNNTTASDGSVNLGWNVDANTTKTFTINDVADPTTSSGTALMFNFWAEANGPYSITYNINGHSHSFAWAWPQTNGFDSRQVVIPLNAGDVQAGTNTFSITPPVMMNVWNFDLLLIGAGGGGSIIATSTPTLLSSPTPTPTPTPVNVVATATSVSATATAIAPTPTPTSTITIIPTPSPVTTVQVPAPPSSGCYNLGAQDGNLLWKPC